MDFDDFLGIVLLVTGTIMIYTFIYLITIPRETTIRLLPNNQIKQIENGKGLQALDKLQIPIYEN